MKRPAFTCPKIDLHVVADLSTEDGQDFNNFSLGDNRYCQNGLSVGKDYLRFEGTTITRGNVSRSVLSMEETIGRGAFNRVQRAIWNDPESFKSKEVAVKEYPLLTATSAHRRQMLIQELKSLCRMDSSSLVQMFGAFLEQESIIIVLEFMNRGSLEDVLEKRKKPFTQPMVAGVAYQLLVGLDFLHQQRVIHRDIKTENCLQDSNGAVKLCDFGLASLGDHSLHKTVVGTTKFMAPERLRAKQYGRSSDLWSVALVWCHLASGEKPWGSVSSMVDLLVAMEETSPEELIPSNIDGGFCDVLVACLQRAPQKRMPAALLLKSPWFSMQHKIVHVKDAAKLIREEESQ